MKKLIYTVEIEFEDEIVSDSEINEVGKNILVGLEVQAETQGIAPENSETFTKSISVTSTITKEKETATLF